MILYPFFDEWHGPGLTLDHGKTVLSAHTVDIRPPWGTVTIHNPAARFGHRFTPTETNTMWDQSLGFDLRWLININLVFLNKFQSHVDERPSTLAIVSSQIRGRNVFRLLETGSSLTSGELF